MCVFIGRSESTPSPAGSRHSLSSPGVRGQPPTPLLPPAGHGEPRGEAEKAAASGWVLLRVLGTDASGWAGTYPRGGKGLSSRRLRSPSLLKCGLTVLDSATPT